MTYEGICFTDDTQHERFREINKTDYKICVLLDMHIGHLKVLWHYLKRIKLKLIFILI